MRETIEELKNMRELAYDNGFTAISLGDAEMTNVFSNEVNTLDKAIGFLEEYCAIIEK